MFHQPLHSLVYRTRLQSFLLLCTLLAIHLWSSPATFAQINQVEGSCPAACGIKIQITNATLTEANDGMFVNVEWTLAQTAPEIKLKNLTVFARVKLGIDSVENTLTVASTARKATLKLSRNFEFDFKDVEVLTTKVTAFAEALPPIPITNIPSKKITGQGNDSAVEVTWGTPPPLPCTASSIAVNVAATNEKGDRLTGATLTALNVRSARIEVKGDTNKKGLRNPEATIQVINSLIGCEEIKNFPPQQAGISGGTGSFDSSSSKVTVKRITFQESGGRVDSTIDWEVAELGGVKATSFNLKFDLEDNTGKITTNNRTASGNDRSAFGPQVQTGGVRSLTVTITATFKNSGNTVVVTKEDKKAQAFNVKGSVKPALADKPAVQPPPPPQNVGLNIGGVKITSESGVHTLTPFWQVNVPTGVTITSFDVEATAIGSQNQVKRSVVAPGRAVLATVNFTFAEVGNQLNKAQVKVIANAKRADGSTFQQTATGEGQPVVPPPPPPPPPVQLKVKTLNSNSSGGNFFIRGSWFIELQPGITVQDFIVEATVLKPTGPLRKTANVGGAVREQSFTFTTAEASGATAVEMKVTANLRRADGSTFQEISTRQAAP